MHRDGGFRHLIAPGYSVWRALPAELDVTTDDESRGVTRVSAVVGSKTPRFHGGWKSAADPDQTPLGMFDICLDVLNPNGTIASTQTFSEYCTPPGLEHPVVSTPALQKFMHQQ